MKYPFNCCLSMAGSLWWGRCGSKGQVVVVNGAAYSHDVRLVAHAFQRLGFMSIVDDLSIMKIAA